MTGHNPTPIPSALVEQALSSFDAYNRARGARSGLLFGPRASPREEQRAFDDLQRAIEKLRDAHTQQPPTN
ncbi:hypothetical protein OG724_27525 [[Kitasatospora] papulosa]|uniref:hypothetical protein n=1 Tax=[Kitasatospora] papulosa TaxID=1464011 RepID=UPI002E37343F|nr:hypothetical protein [[Kitasatospora] papulosa]